MTGARRPKASSSADGAPDKKKRVQRKWTEQECEDVLNSMKETVLMNGQIEKPTAAEYYKKLMAKIKLEGVTTIQLGSKVRALRDTYTRAIEWCNNTGQGVLASDGEESVMAYIKKMCPFWDLLDEIYGSKVNITPPFIHDSNGDKTNIRDMESAGNVPQIVIHHDQDDVVFDFEIVEENLQLNPETVNAIHESNAQTEKVRRNLVAPPKGIKLQKDAFSALNEVQVKRIEAMNQKTELDQKRLDAERTWNSESLDFKRQELESQERRHQLELELKLKEMETQKELKLKELEKEERIEKYKIDMEFKLQLELKKAQQ